MRTVLFYDNNLNERGTSVATYDYADYNEKILGNKSIIVYNNSNNICYDKYKNRFDTMYGIDNITEISSIKCDYFYHLKYGYDDNIYHSNSKNLVHVVFPCFDPHGDVYAYISEWLSKHHGNGYPFVPHMVNLPKVDYDYRDYFNLKNKLVIGWYGGNNFEIDFAKKVVIDIAKKRTDIVFLFMNLNSFCDLDNVFFIERTIDLNKKSAFINTCDMMIHARERGETFGLAVAEFSSMNKPIITYKNSPERNHIEILGDKGIYYSNYSELYSILNSIQLSDILYKEWNCYEQYTPENVMVQFKNVFL